MIRHFINRIAKINQIRNFGLKRPEDRLLKKAYKEFKRVDKNEISSEKLKQKYEKKEMNEEEKEKILEKKRNELIDNIVPKYKFMNLAERNTYSRYDAAMGKELYWSEKLQNKITKACLENPIDKTYQRRLRYFPLPRTLSIAANIESHKDKDGDSHLMLTSTFMPGETIALPREIPIDWEKRQLEICYLDQAFSFPKLLRDITKVVTTKPKPNEWEEYEKKHYPPNLFTYFKTLPLWAQNEPSIRTFVVGLEFHKPEVSLWDKETALSKLVARIGRITPKEEMLIEAAFDKHREQMNMEKVIKAVEESHLYPVLTEEISEAEKLDYMFQEAPVFF